MIKLKVPGKLFIMGEYSVIKPGNEAVLVAIDKFIHVHVKDNSDYQFSSELGHFRWMLSDQLPVLVYDNLTHAKAAIYTAHRFLKYKGVAPKSYSIQLFSELYKSNEVKYGLGSSGAVIVAIIQGILKFHNIEATNMEIFKLSVLAQIEISDVTSGGELAASIYGGWVFYQRYDLIWILNRKGHFNELMEMTWPLLKIEKLSQPRLNLVVCFSGFSQSTKAYTDKLAALNGSSLYSNFLNKTKLIVTQFKEALIRSDLHTIKYMVELYRQMLLELEQQANITIESESFKKMIQIANDLGHASKTSGAGYGDCGIAIVKNMKEKSALQHAWQEAGLDALDLKVWYKDE